VRGVQDGGQSRRQQQQRRRRFHGEEKYPTEMVFHCFGVHE